MAVANEEIEKIIIRAPYERVEIKRSTPSQPRLKTETMELMRFVDIDDLDLTKNADLTELNSRIESIAEESCQKLSDMFPLNPSDLTELHSCKRKAIASTKTQLVRVIEAAN